MSGEPKPFTCLVVEDDDELRELIGFLLESKFKAVVKYAASGNQALAILKSEAQNIDLIVSDNRMADGDGTDLYREMFETQITTPFILCSSDTPDMYPEYSLRPLTAYVPKPVIQKPLVEAVKQFLATRKELADETLVPALGDFIRIHIRLLKLAGTLPGEAFIRVSENKFVRTYKAGDPFTDAEFEKNQIKNIEHLYIKQAAIAPFLDQMLEKHKASHPDVSISINQYLESTIQDIGTRLGFTQDLERMTKESMKRAIKIIELNPSLAESLKMINLNNRNYISTHSTALTCVSCWLANKVGWQKEEVLTKLVLASLIHDITLSDEEIAKIQDEKEFLDDHFKITVEGVKAWREHPNKAAKIAAHFSEIPRDVDLIIQQHHEQPHGEGMPNHVDHTKISALSALFIIAHDLTGYLLNPNSSSAETDIHSTLKKFVCDKSKTYDVGQFASIMQKLV